MGNKAGIYSSEFEVSSQKVIEGLKPHKDATKGYFDINGLGLKAIYEQASQYVLTEMYNAKEDAPINLTMVNGAIENLSEDQQRMYGDKIRELLEDGFKCSNELKIQQDYETLST